MLKPNVVCRIKREAMGMTQADLAKVVGCTGNTISNYEAGKRNNRTGI